MTRSGQEKLSVTLIGQSAPLASTSAVRAGMCFFKEPHNYWISIYLCSILANRKRIWGSMPGVRLRVCVCLSVRVSWSDAFTTGGFECCSLLWCNTSATRKSELMNRKLLLMIVKTLLSPHVASGHLSDTGWTYSSRHTLTHHTR